MKVTWKRLPPDGTLWLYTDLGGAAPAGAYEIALVEEIEYLRAVLAPFAEAKTTSTGDSSARHWQCLVSAEHLEAAREALAQH